MKRKVGLLAVLLLLISLGACSRESGVTNKPLPTPAPKPTTTSKQLECEDAHSFPNEADICVKCGENYYSTTLEFSLNDTRDSYTISGIGTCTRTVIKVPETYKGRPVTSVNSMAFYGNADITEVVLPQTVTQIGEAAFTNCYALTKINIPNGVTVIEDRVFNNCWALEHAPLPDGLTTVKKKAFGGCLVLSGIQIPQTVTYIGESAFASCRKIADIVLPDGLTFLGMNAFNGCESIESIRIPAGITKLEESTFGCCYALKNVEIAGEVTEIGLGAFNYCTALTEITLPDTVTSIALNAFSNCLSLRRVILPSQIEYFAPEVFKKCDALEYNIYEGGKYLGTADKEFLYFMGVVDSAQEELVIHDDAIVFPEDAFGGTQLRKLTIGKSLRNMHFYAFSNFGALEEIVVAEGNPVFKVVNNCLIDVETKTLVRATKNAVIPDDGSVTVIGQSAFAYLKDLRSVVIPDAILSIKRNAFLYCDSIEELVIGVGVQFIHNDQLIGAKKFSRVFYHGTQSEWDAIAIYGEGAGGVGIGANVELLGATLFCYSETPPTESGNYWHYVDGVPTPWKTEE